MNTRMIRFENFRNLGIEEDKKQNEKLSHTLKLGSIDDEHVGGLIVLLGGNNEGKSNVLAGLEALGNRELEEVDKPNFNDHEKSEVKISLEYQIRDIELSTKLEQDMGKEKKSVKDTKADLEIAEINDFAGKKFGLFFTPGSLEKGVEKNGSESESEYIQFIEEMLNEQETYTVYGIDEVGDREEIRLIVKGKDRMLLCSAKGGKSLKCFSVVEKRYEEVKDKERAILLQCEFEVGKTQAPKGCDDVSKLRNYLQKGFEEAQGTTQDGTIFHTKKTAHPLILKAELSLKDSEVRWHTDLPKEQYESEDTKGFYKYIKTKIEEMRQRINVSKLSNLEETLQKAQSYDEMRRIYQDLIAIYRHNISSYYYYRNDPEIEFRSANSFLKNSERDIDILAKHKKLTFMPKIVKYEESALSDDDLEVESKKLSKSKFFKTLFDEILKVDMKSVLDSIEKDGGKRRKKESDLSKKCEEISRRFNAMYCLSDDVYDFGLRIEETKVSFCMEKNGETIYLNQQSTGFQKFFNLFFNFLYDGSITKGDIVLFDEPENSLSIPAQKELRFFLRQFGQEHGITFVISTHSSYMLDVRHLDEVRIVKKNEYSKGSMIVNDFSMLDYGKSDVLSGIYKALGGSIDLESERIVFVEGIMDAHILNGYAHIYARHHSEVPQLIFLPIGGLGECKEGESGMSEEQREKAENLIKFAKSIHCPHPVLLVDSDKAGEAMKMGVEESQAKFKDISVIELKDACAEFKTIETLLSQKDMEKFGLKEAKVKKEASLCAAAFKDYAFKFEDSEESRLEKILSKESKDNFDKLFSCLIGFKKLNED